MADTNPAGVDSRTNSELMRQWKKLQEVKRSLVKEGVVNGDATAAQVLTAVRQQIPTDLLIV